MSPVYTTEIIRFALMLRHTSVQSFKDTHREKAPSNKIPALRKSTKWAFGLLVNEVNYP